MSEPKEIPMYIRVCKKCYNGILDIENFQLYTEEQIREEAICIDYVDEEEIDSMSIEDLQEVFARNDELLFKAGNFVPFNEGFEA